MEHKLHLSTGAVPLGTKAISKKIPGERLPWRHMHQAGTPRTVALYSVSGMPRFSLVMSISFSSNSDTRPWSAQCEGNERTQHQKQAVSRTSRGLPVEWAGRGMQRRPQPHQAPSAAAARRLVVRVAPAWTNALHQALPYATNRRIAACRQRGCAAWHAPAPEPTW